MSFYGAGHLITTTFGQWPIWPGWGKNYYIKNCSPDGSAALFAVKPTFGTTTSFHLNLILLY
jgi:hypothetical protein